MKVVAKIIIRDKNSKILVLVRGSTHPSFADHLDFPGGEVEFGEDYIATIAREVTEEVGLDLSPPKIRLLFDKKVNEELVHILYGYKLDETEPKVKLSWEHSSYKWMSSNSLLNTQLSGGTDPYFKDVIEYLIALK